MKKTRSLMLIALLFIASSFTSKTNSTHVLETDIVNIVSAEDFLSTLLAAIEAGGLLDELKEDGPFTLFAPTNEAFAKLPIGVLENLMKPENKATLAAVLNYHVVPGKVLTKDLKNGQKVKTIQGSEITITLIGGKSMINNAAITRSDLIADNGVVHVIETVILPVM